MKNIGFCLVLAIGCFLGFSVQITGQSPEEPFTLRGMVNDCPMPVSSEDYCAPLEGKVVEIRARCTAYPGNCGHPTYYYAYYATTKTTANATLDEPPGSFKVKIPGDIPPAYTVWEYRLEVLTPGWGAANSIFYTDMGDDAFINWWNDGNFNVIPL